VSAVAMEWVKLRSLRSTWWTLGITVAAAVGIGVPAGLAVKGTGQDLTNTVLSGIAVGLLLIGTLGVVTMSAEFSSGLIASTFAAVPDRRRVLAAKAAVFGAVALVMGELAAFIAFIGGSLSIRGGGPRLVGSLQPIVLSGIGIALVGLMGLGIGAIVRHTAPAVAVLVGGVYIGTQVFGFLAHAAMGYVPLAIVANSLSSAHPEPGFLRPWPALVVLVLETAAVLAAGAWLLDRRDA
jgi:ABC-2 type transport system permease protein